VTKEEFLEHWDARIRQKTAREWLRRDLNRLLESEREACAKVADYEASMGSYGPSVAADIAAAIRARKP
jgi:predicted component of type VI protein secretion system